MVNYLSLFEKIARNAVEISEPQEEKLPTLHPFESRNIHPKLPSKVLSLFDDGHYEQSTFEAYKFVDNVIKKISGESKSGRDLMMNVFKEPAPKIKLTPCKNTSETDEQEGYKFLFAGSMMAIRNPRAHENDLGDDPDTCLDHLSFASILLRRLEKAGYEISTRKPGS